MKHFRKILLGCLLVSFAINTGATGIHAEKYTDSTFKERVFSLPGGVQLSYVEQGRKESATVIFLHGYSDSWRSFENVLPLLPRNMHAVAISMRGHGNSSKPSSGYRLKDFAADVAAFIQANKLGACILVGHSMGGLIVQQFALDYPQFTKAIVIVSSDASFADNPGLPEFKKEIMNLSDTVEYAFAEAFQKSTLARPIDSSFLETCIAQSVMMPVYVWQSAAEEIFKADYTHQLQNIQAPVLIFWGSKDTFCPRYDQEKLHKNIKRSSLLIYEGTGHSLHWEEPRRFVNDLLYYIQTTGMDHAHLKE
jgi:pimeloyl-ACP methyl ester carboxylesterase